MSESLQVVQGLARRDTGRMRRYGEALRFYQGEQWVGPAARRERRLVLNYVKAVIGKTASFTLRGMRSVVDPRPVDVSEAEATAVERALADVYEANDLAGLDYDSEVDASILGDGAFRVVWDVDGKAVLVTAPDVQGLYVWPLPADLSRFWRLAHRYQVPRDELAMVAPSAAAELMGAVAGSVEVPREESRQWSASMRRGQFEVVEVWTKTTFELFVSGRLFESKPNPYGFIPYVVYPNVRVPKQFWGESDIEAMREPQRELNRAFTQLSRILEVSGSPITVLEGVTQSVDIAVSPGAVWELPAEAKAYLLSLLEGGGVDLHTRYIDLVYRTLHDLGESPRIAFGEADSSAASGVALNLQMDPLMKKVERKRMIRGAAFRARDAMVLRLLDSFTGTEYAGVPTRIQWGELLPVDRQRLVQEEATLVASGVHSRRRAAQEVGVEDPDAEFRQWRTEEEEIAGGERDSDDVGAGPERGD